MLQIQEQQASSCCLMFLYRVHACNNRVLYAFTKLVYLQKCIPESTEPILACVHVCMLVCVWIYEWEMLTQYFANPCFYFIFAHWRIIRINQANMMLSHALPKSLHARTVTFMIQANMHASSHLWYKPPCTHHHIYNTYESYVVLQVKRATSMLACENSECARRFCEHCLLTHLGDTLPQDTRWPMTFGTNVSCLSVCLFVQHEIMHTYEDIQVSSNGLFETCPCVFIRYDACVCIHTCEAMTIRTWLAFPPVFNVMHMRVWAIFSPVHHETRCLCAHNCTCWFACHMSRSCAEVIGTCMCLFLRCARTCVR